MHWIERSQLVTLLRMESASMTQLTPDDIEANLASHYLRRLMSEGYVERIDRGKYTLTSRGQQFVGNMNSSTGKIAGHIKSVIILYAEDDSGRPLFFTWKRQPYLGMTTLLHDRMAYGQTLEQAAKHAQIEKLGSEHPSEYVGSGFVRIIHDSVLVSHMNAHMYRLQIHSSTTFPIETRNGTASFDIDEKSKMKNLDDLIATIKNDMPAPFDIELEY